MSENLALQKEAQNADQLAAEINLIKRQTYEYVLKSSVEIGERLTAAKELVPYGGWADWLKEKVDYSQSTANNFMRIYKEFSDDQLSLSGKTKSETFGSLTYSQAVALFALPEHQREEFVETHDVSEMSARQLKEAIAAQKLAEAERDQARSETEAARTKTAALQRELDSANAEVKRFDKECEKANRESLQAELKAKKLQKELDEANAKMKELTSATAEISEKEKAAIEEKVKQKYEGRVNQLTLDVETERKRAETIATEKAALEAKAAQARNEEMLKLNILFEQAQEHLITMKELMDSFPDERRAKLYELVRKTLKDIFGGN